MTYFIPLILFFGRYCIADRNGLIITHPLNANNKPISPGPEDYKSLLNDSEVLIDKSLLIKEIIGDAAKVFLITCPRRWGKSVNLNMIKTFVQIQTTNGTPISPITSTSHYRLFVNGELEVGGNVKKFKTPLLIAQYPDFVDSHLGKYPVIHVTNLYDLFFDNSIHKMRTSVVHVFQEYLYMVPMLEKTINEADNSTRVEAQRRLEKFNKYSSEDNITATEFAESLNFLCELLHWRFGKKVFVLVDEYQSPWEEALFMNSANSEEADKKFFKIYENFIEKTFVSNEYLEKGILTGVPSALQDLRRTAFNSMVECNLVSGKFMKHYGINRDELTSLFRILNVSSAKQEEAHRWYNGYKANKKVFPIYNPWSIACYLVDYVPDTYWINTWGVTFENFMDIDQFRDQLHSLLDGNIVTVNFVHQRFLWVEYKQLFNARIGRISLKSDNAELTNNAFMYLLMLGYLTLGEYYFAAHKYYKMRLPNFEIKKAMKTQLDDFYHNRMSFDMTSKQVVADELHRCMHNDEIACVQLKDTIENHLPIRLVLQEEDDERVLHMMLCWLLIDTHCLQKEFHSPGQKLQKAQLLLVFENRTVIMRATYAQPSSYFALQEAKTWTNATHEVRHPIREVKFIGINLHTNKHIDVSSEVVKY